MNPVQNPLENILVVTNLVKYLKIKDLKNFRLVSPLWNHASRKQFQNQSCITLRGDTNIIRSFLQDKIDIFINFKFLNLTLYGKNKRRIERLFEKVGVFVREVAFVKCFGDYVTLLDKLENLTVLSIVLPGSFDEFPQDYNEHTSQLNIKSFSRALPLKCLEVTGSSDVDARLISWSNFIQGFPNLEVLSAQCRFSEDLIELLSALSVQPLVKLSDFSCVLVDLHNSHLEMMTKLNVNFYSLDVALSEGIDPFYLIALLKNHSATLKSLKLFRESEKSLICLSSSLMTVTLSNLTTLELQCNMVESFAFLNLTPNLKTLNLSQFGDGDVSFYNTIVKSTKSSFGPFFSLQSFCFEYFLSPDCIERISKFFPNLIRLSTYLTDESIRVVFRDMKNLQELTVLGTQLSDEGVTGVPLHILERKYRFMKDYRKFPYIGNLTKLWRFVLYQLQEKITDYSVTYGFLDAVNLSSIEIPETAISNQAIETLQQKSNLVTLTSPCYTRSGNIYNRPGQLQEHRMAIESHTHDCID